MKYSLPASSTFTSRPASVPNMSVNSFSCTPLPAAPVMLPALEKLATVNLSAIYLFAARTILVIASST